MVISLVMVVEDGEGVVLKFWELLWASGGHDGTVRLEVRMRLRDSLKKALVSRGLVFELDLHNCDLHNFSKSTLHLSVSLSIHTA
jgi:hypothetical protein